MEYANAAITIGGKIKRSDVERLAEVIADEHVSPDWSDSLDEAAAIEEIEACAREKRHLRLCRSEQPWGRFEDLEAICEELQLTFLCECEAGGEWSPFATFRQPEMGTRKQNVPVFQNGQSVLEEQDVPVFREWSIAEIGRGPMIDAEDIQAMLDAGTLAAELALMTAVHKFPWPIEIVEDADWIEPLKPQIVILVKDPMTIGPFTSGPPDLTAVTREIAEGGQ